MSQLIKLEDFISRYEQDIYHYSSQFVSMKNEEWSRLKQAFDAGDISHYLIGGEENTPALEELPEEGSFRKKIMRLFLKDRGKTEGIAVELSTEIEEEVKAQVRFLRTVPANEQELKQAFLDYFCPFQLKWALGVSEGTPAHLGRYQFDRQLRFVLQRFPDNCLVLYKPVLELKNAAVELEIILLTPSEAWCLVFLEAEDEAVFVGEEGRFWTKTHHNKADKKVLNPMITLQRMQWILEQIFAANEISFPVRRGIICRNGYINDPNGARAQEIIDKRRFARWFSSIRHNRSAIKNLQLKAAKALLSYSSSINKKRMNKEEEELIENHGESGSQ